LVGKEKEASVIVAAAKKDVSTIYERAKKLAPKKVFWQIDTVPLVTINNSTFTADLIKFSGGVNIFYDLKAAYSRISREEVIKRNPDIIIIAALGKPAVDEKTFWLKFREMNAVKNNRVFIVDPYEVCQPTPAKFLESLKIAANLINPGIVNNE
jgi:iron complex transport system substrate-binding protein